MLYEVRVLDAEGEVLHLARTGFRELVNARGEDLALEVNGQPVFARGALWTPPGWPELAPSREELRRTLEQVRDAGMNMVRVPGTGAYESEAFHDLCDELGLLVWQDFMFANLDYPIADEGFRALVEEEARQVLGRIAGRPSLAVLCGNSEIEQQVAMLGLDADLGRGELFGELLPGAGRRGRLGRRLPALGALRRRPALPLRTAAWPTTSGWAATAGRWRTPAGPGCASPPSAWRSPTCPTTPAMPVHDPRWKEGVPRDAGTGWDFEDVRDHYLELLHGVDPVELRSVDNERYLELSRAVSGEVMAATFGEWRREASPCQGGLVLWLRDLVPGAGWGLLDHEGRAQGRAAPPAPRAGAGGGVADGRRA